MVSVADGHAFAGPAPGEAAHAPPQRHQRAEDRADVPPAPPHAQRRHLQSGGEGRAVGPAVRVPRHPGARALGPAETHRGHQNEHKLPAVLSLLDRTSNGKKVTWNSWIS